MYVFCGKNHVTMEAREERNRIDCHVGFCALYMLCGPHHCYVFLFIFCFHFCFIFVTIVSTFKVDKVVGRLLNNPINERHV